MSVKNNTPDWQPTTRPEILIARAEMLSKIRDFFKSKKVIEVDTPALSLGTVTDVYLESMTSCCSSVEGGSQTLYLQTSPEFAMKRLIAAGSGCIYQICHAFRDDESGRVHNPEFLLLEWYRMEYDHFQLMSEMDELLCLLLGTKKAHRVSYQQLFIDYLHFDPLTASTVDIQQIVLKKINGLKLDDRDQMLQVLFSSLIEPSIAKNRPLMVFDYPASQSALACLSASDQRVAERFEVYYRGVELANGFHELTNAEEQRQRFLNDNLQRKATGKEEKPLDERFLSAIGSGLPDCSGVALGLDRLLMLLLQKESIAEVMPFPINRA